MIDDELSRNTAGYDALKICNLALTYGQITIIPLSYEK